MEKKALNNVMNSGSCSRGEAAPDAIYFNGKILTVDSAFSITQALAIKGDHFLEVGTNEDILALAGVQTKKIDLQGHTVVPGLIEAHAHPEMASLSELEQSLPNPRNLDELLTWIKQQARLKPEPNTREFSGTRRREGLMESSVLRLSNCSISPLKRRFQ